MVGPSWADVGRPHRLPRLPLPTEVIHYAIRLYYLFSLSLRASALILAERGVVVCLSPLAIGPASWT